MESELKEGSVGDEREFHELAMDYRGASVGHVAKAYESLAAFVDARIARSANVQGADIVGWQNRHAPDQIVEGKSAPDSSDKWVPLFYASTSAAPQLPASTEPLNSTQQFWLDNRSKIIAAIEHEGLTLMSNQHCFFLMKLGKAEAQTAPAGPMPSPSAITAWLETPDGKAAVMRAYAKLQADIAGLNEARAVSHADLNEPMPSTASEDERAAFESWAWNWINGNGIFTSAMPKDFEDGFYVNNDVQNAWDAWKARAALAKPSTIASAENSGVRNAASPAAPALRDDESASGRLDMDVLARSYHFALTVDGKLMGLTEGDMHYEDTGIALDGIDLAAWKAGCEYMNITAAPVAQLGLTGAATDGITNEMLRDEYHREFSTSWMYGGKVGGSISTFDEWKAKRAAATPGDAAKGDANA